MCAPSWRLPVRAAAERSLLSVDGAPLLLILSDSLLLGDNEKLSRNLAAAAAADHTAMPECDLPYYPLFLLHVVHCRVQELLLLSYA